MATEMDKPNGPRTIKASEFKAKCLKLMDEVAESGEEIIVTKNGKAVAKLSPLRQKPDVIFGIDRDTIQFHGDIGSPIPAEWFKDLEEKGNELF